MTKDEAMRMFDSCWWKHLPAKEVAAFQMHEDLLCMPFVEFQRVVEEALGRPVFTHEFAYNREGMQKELVGEKAAPTFAEILSMLPVDKPVIVVAS